MLAQNSSLGAKILAENGVTLDRAEMALNLTAKPLVITIVSKGLSAEVVELIRIAWQLAVEFGQEKLARNTSFMECCNSTRRERLNCYEI